jgi:hypothetical protein
MFLIFALAALVTLLSASAGLALPVSSCINTIGADSNIYTCSLYPTNSNGGLSKKSSITYATYGIADQSPGYLILLKPGTTLTKANEKNRSNWDEVVSFPDLGGIGEASQAILCDAASCFPTYKEVKSKADPFSLTFFTDMNANGIYYYPLDAGVISMANYVIYTPGALPLSDDVTDTPNAITAATPEPASAGLFLLGIVGLFAAGHHPNKERNP